MTPGGVNDGAVFACGVDVIDLESWKRHLLQSGPLFLERLYTDHERERCEGDPGRLAARFAVKEAVLKALGTGFRGVEPTEVEVVSLEHGQPTLRLHGAALARAQVLGLDAWRVSLSYADALVVAFVVAQASPGAAAGRAVGAPTLEPHDGLDLASVASVYVSCLVGLNN